MTNLSWGTKRNCVSCGAHFYDLNKVPAVCPKCNHAFDPNTQTRSRRKAAKRDSGDDKGIEILATVLPGKKTGPVKKRDAKQEPDDAVGGLNDIAEIEDVSDMDSLEELSELEQIEETPVNEDDADEEALIEDIQPADQVLVENIEDEEENELDDDDSEEEADEDEDTDSSGKRARSRKK